MRLVVLMLCFLTFVPAASAARWERVGGSGPGARADSALAATRDGRVWLFGGQARGRPLGDLWALDTRARRWMRFPTDGPGPPARFGHNLVAEPGGTLILFGGQTASGFLDDVWRLRTRRWRRIPVSGGPSARNQYAAAQSARGWFIHGGAGARGLLADLWRFDFARRSFRRVRPDGRGPGARTEHTAALSGRLLVVFGGRGRRGALGDTWTLRL